MNTMLAAIPRMTTYMSTLLVHILGVHIATGSWAAQSSEQQCWIVIGWCCRATWSYSCWTYVTKSTYCSTTPSSNTLWCKGWRVSLIITLTSIVCVTDTARLCCCWYLQLLLVYLYQWSIVATVSYSIDAVTLIIDQWSMMLLKRKLFSVAHTSHKTSAHQYTLLCCIICNTATTTSQVLNPGHCEECVWRASRRYTQNDSYTRSCWACWIWSST